MVFEVAARHGNLTHAANELCIAQSAVSRHVSNLEQQVGFPLFRREGNRLELTEAGYRLSDAIGIGLGHIRQVLTVLQQKSRDRVFTIACTYDMAHSWLMPRFSSLAKVAEGYQLRLITSDSYADFDAPDVDVSVRLGQGNWEEHASVRLFDEEAFPICSATLLKQHPDLAGASPERLMEFPLLQLTSDRVVGISWEQWLCNHGASFPVVEGPVFSNYTLMLFELLAGHGIGLGYANIVDQYCADGRIVRLTQDSIRSGFCMYAVYKTPTLSPVTDAVISWLQESARQSSFYPPGVQQ